MTQAAVARSASDEVPTTPTGSGTPPQGCGVGAGPTPLPVACETQWEMQLNMLSFWDLISCGGVMQLHSNWGKFKTFVTSSKEPEPAAQAEASSAACLPPTDPAGRGCCQQLSHPGSQASALASGCPSPPGQGREARRPSCRAKAACPPTFTKWPWPERQPWLKVGEQGLVDDVLLGFQGAGWAAGPLRWAGGLRTSLGMRRGQAPTARAGAAASPSGAGPTGSSFQEAQRQHGGQTVAGAA